MHKLIEDTINYKDRYVNLFEVLMHVIETSNYDIDEAAKIIKKNKPFMTMLIKDCKNNNILKERLILEKKNYYT